MIFVYVCIINGQTKMGNVKSKSKSKLTAKFIGKLNNNESNDKTDLLIDRILSRKKEFNWGKIDDYSSCSTASVSSDSDSDSDNDSDSDSDSDNDSDSDCFIGDDYLSCSTASVSSDSDNDSEYSDCVGIDEIIQYVYFAKNNQKNKILI